jgi:hypothetical protein
MPPPLPSLQSHSALDAIKRIVTPKPTRGACQPAIIGLLSHAQARNCKTVMRLLRSHSAVPLAFEHLAAADTLFSRGRALQQDQNFQQQPPDLAGSGGITIIGVFGSVVVHHHMGKQPRGECDKTQETWKACSPGTPSW